MSRPCPDVPADFAGIVSASRGEDVEFERAYGFADRAHQVPVRPETRFAIASGSKAFTAIVVASLLAEGALSVDTPARSLLGDDLPLVDERVTVEHLLTHTSGIGDYVDEETGELPLKVPVYRLVDTEDYLPALDGFATKFAPGARFGYCNSGYVLLALLAERASGRSFHALVEERVLGPAGMAQTAYLRSDALPGDAAIGYLPDGRTNVFALPVRGNGDGGAYTTVADVRRFWRALTADRLLPGEWTARIVTPQAAGPPTHRLSYGWGVWLSGTAVVLDGGDHGVSFRSEFDRASGSLWTVVSNTGNGIAPLVPQLREFFAGGDP